MIDEINNFRFANRCKSEVDAIRMLIERGLREHEAVARPAAPVRVNVDPRGRPPGPYPWEAPDLAKATEALNVRLPAALKSRLDWLVHKSGTDGRVLTLRSMVTTALTAYVGAELRALGVEET
jgi:hypothetical protein